MTDTNISNGYKNILRNSKASHKIKTSKNWGKLSQYEIIAAITVFN
jgi:hypothetical protein